MEKEKHLDITVFHTLMQSKGSELISLKSWLELIRDGMWRTEVELIRTLRGEGRKDEADRMKRRLPAAVVAGDCMPGRFPKYLTRRTGMAVMDIDHIDPERLEELKTLLMDSFAWVAAVHTTSSGCGLRIVARLGEVHPDCYRRAYAMAAAELERLTRLPCDMQCKDLCRATFASYDPLLRMRRDMGDVPLFPYPEGFDPFAPPAAPVPALPAAREDAACAHTAAPDVADFLDRFLARHPYVKGSRNAVLLRMGQRARYEGLSAAGLGLLKRAAFERLGGDGMTFRDFDTRLDWGWNHSDERPRQEPARVQRVPRVHNGCAFPQNDAQCAENNAVGTEEGEEERMDKCPYFNDEIFALLPPLIRRGVEAAEGRRQRDMLLMGMLANLSGCLPMVRTVYARRRYSPHFYFAAVAPAGAGKGILAFAASLGEMIHADMERENRRLRREYDRRMSIWETEQRNAARQKRVPDFDLRPEEPPRRVLLVPASTSKSQLMLDLEASGEIGLVMNATEIDSLSASLAADYGKLSGELRSAYHHEAFGQNFKVDGRQIRVRHPRIALCFAGTPGQLATLIPTMEDGMYSRFAFLTGAGVRHWVSAAPNEDEGMTDNDALFDELAAEVKRAYDFLLQSPTTVRFTAAQWCRHEQVFSRAMRHVLCENEENTVAVVGRHGLLAIRIAMIFTALRKFDDGWQMAECTCSDADFDTALSIVRVLLAHSLELSTILLKDKGRRRTMTSFFKVHATLTRLPERFSYTDFIGAAGEEGVSRSSAKRALKRLLDEQILVHADEGYMKTSKC